MRRASIKICASTRLCRTAGTIKVLDTEGREGRVRIDALRPGDRVCTLYDLVVESDEEDEPVCVDADTTGTITATSPSIPALRVSFPSASGGEASDRLLDVSPENVVLLLSSDDPRL